MSLATNEAVARAVERFDHQSDFATALNGFLAAVGGYPEDPLERADVFFSLFLGWIRGRAAFEKALQDYAGDPQ